MRSRERSFSWCVIISHHILCSFLRKYFLLSYTLYLIHTLFLSSLQLNASLSVYQGYSRSTLSKKYVLAIIKLFPVLSWGVFRIAKARHGYMRKKAESCLRISVATWILCQRTDTVNSSPTERRAGYISSPSTCFPFPPMWQVKKSTTASRCFLTTAAPLWPTAEWSCNTSSLIMVIVYTWLYFILFHPTLTLLNFTTVQLHEILQ